VLFKHFAKSVSSSTIYPARCLTETCIVCIRFAQRNGCILSARVSQSFPLSLEQMLTLRKLQLSSFKPRNIWITLTLWFFMGMPTIDIRASTCLCSGRVLEGFYNVSTWLSFFEQRHLLRLVLQSKEELVFATQSDGLLPLVLFSHQQQHVSLSDPTVDGQCKRN